MNFENQVVVVTGGSRGIGRAIACEFASKKGTVVISYIKGKEEAEKTIAEIERLGGRGLLYGFDVSQFEATQKVFAEIQEKCGRIDVLVNNAGMTRDALLVRMKEQDWDDVINTNLKGVFNCSRSAVRLMMKQRYGRIINLTSVIGQIGNAGQVAYAASKAGIIGLTKSLAKELARSAVSVNAVAPGFITTEMTTALPENVQSAILESIPMGTFGTPEDVAHLVCFLASQEAGYITGQIIGVNGGMI